MNHWTVLLAVEAATEVEGGGLFDLDATLPLMAIQFLLLAATLNVVFYKPLGEAIDQRADYIRSNQVEARERLDKAERLAKQYEQEIAETRKQSQAVIVAAQTAAQEMAVQQVAEAQREAQTQLQQAQAELEQQKQEAFKSLENQVDTLSRQILEKLLGSQLV